MDAARRGLCHAAAASTQHNAEGEEAGALCWGDACVRGPPARAPQRAR